MKIDFPEPGEHNLPRMSVTIPSNWVSVPADDAVLAVAAPDRLDEFRPNVVITASAHPAPMDTDAWVLGLHQRLNDLNSVEVGQETDFNLDGLPAHRIRFSYRHPIAGTLVQELVSVVLPQPDPGDATVPVLEILGSAGADRIAEDFGVVTEVVRSLSMEPLLD